MQRKVDSGDWGYATSKRAWWTSPCLACHINQYMLIAANSSKLNYQIIWRIVKGLTKQDD